MKIIISGGTGFLGRPLAAALAAQAHEVVVLTRGAAGWDAVGRRVSWNPTDAVAPDAPWAAEVDGADVIVNLAGEGIATGRWTERRKEALRQSRILSTRSLVAAMRQARRRPSLLISGSAIGFYGDSGGRIVDESSPPGSDFLATLCVDWEAEAHAAEALGCRVAPVRTGIVLAAGGGALKKMLPAFQWFVGGPIGSGRQFMSWIHREDWIRVVEWMIQATDLIGAINATAPEPVTNGEFSQTLARTLGRPSWLTAPGPALRLALGEMAGVALLSGQRVVPKRALDAGLAFRYTRLEDALAEILARR